MTEAGKSRKGFRYTNPFPVTSVDLSFIRSTLFNLRLQESSIGNWTHTHPVPIDRLKTTAAAIYALPKDNC